MRKLYALGITFLFTTISFGSNELATKNELEDNSVQFIEKTLNVEVSGEKKPCKYSANVRDRNGNRLELAGEAIEGKPTYASDCGIFFSKWISDLEEQGYKIDKSSYTWE